MLANTLKNMTLISASLWLAACASVGPDYQAQALPEFVADPEVVIAEREQQWWQRFNDPQLTQLVEITLTQNHSLAAARHSVDAAYALFADVDNDQLPQGSVDLDYIAQEQAIPGLVDEQINARTYRGGATLRWDLDLFGKLDRAAEAARAEAEAQFYLWQDFQVSLIAQVVGTYSRYKGLQKRVDVANRNIASLTQTQQLIQARVDAGFASELDVLRIQAQLNGVQATVPALQAATERAKQTLVALAGGNQHVAAIDWQIPTLPDLDQPVAIGNPKALLRQRPDLRVSERRVASATANIGVNTADLYPNLSVSGFLGFLSGSASALGADTQAWSLAPSLSWPAFDLASVQARIDAANARQQAAIAEFHQAVLDAVAETQSALADYTHLRQQRHFLEAQVNASDKALQLARARYDAGAIDLLDLLDAERTLLGAKDSLVQAQTQSLQALVNIYRAFGGGLQPLQPGLHSVEVASI